MTQESISRVGRNRRLLVVDDDRDNIELVTRTFRQHFEIHRANDGESGLDLARCVEPDVIVADQRLPKMSGVELLSIIERELPKTVRILVTAYADIEPTIAAINTAHVHYFAEKPVHPLTLASTVAGLVHHQELEIERESRWGQITRTVCDLDHANQILSESEEHLQKLVEQRTLQLNRVNNDLIQAKKLMQQLSLRDELTGLFNYHYLFEQLAFEIARARRYMRTFGVILFDIDAFTSLNLNLGTITADQILIKIAQLLQGNGINLRQSDYAIRYGSYSFGVLLPETNCLGTSTKAEHIRQTIEAYTWRQNIPELIQNLTVSVGIACYPENGSDPQEMLMALHHALALAQKQGGNCIAIAS
ncbi:MAG: diguanylate cyclase [Deltaproteobacteria bacterium]|nr:diguanylate cyclase [Deltaproteobacteria bacterium]